MDSTGFWDYILALSGRGCEVRAVETRQGQKKTLLQSAHAFVTLWDAYFFVITRGSEKLVTVGEAVRVLFLTRIGLRCDC